MAHQTELMARQKHIRDVSHYMPKEAAREQTGASKLLAMFKRFKAKQDKKQED